MFYRFFRSYIVRHFYGILAVAIIAIVFLISFIFSGIDTIYILYPFSLSYTLIIIIFVLNMLKEYRQFKDLRKLTDEILVRDAEMPLSEDEEIIAYQEMVMKLLEKQREIENSFNMKYEALSDYYATWTHQIKIPIASAKLMLENNDSEESRLLNIELGRIERYVKMAVNYLKLEDNNIDFVFEKSDVDSIVKDVVRSYSNDFIVKKLRFEFLETGLKVLTDEKWLSFVLEQIISNSLKYTEKGYIKVYGEKNNLIIEDSGIGISANDLPRIFEKGFSGFNGRNNKTSSGLGLYLVKRICDKLDIKIKVESKEKNGTKVILEFNKKMYDFE